MASPGDHRNKASIYKPLPSATSIRVLTWVSAAPSSNQNFRCQLNVVDLGPHPTYGSLESGRQQVVKYDALSYVWGSTNDQVVITCNSKLVLIRRSLYAALSEIWGSHPEKIIWADALCINQSDVKEKSTQVASMHRIFASAEKVLVWLGPACENTRLVFAILNTARAIGQDDLDKVLDYMKKNNTLRETYTPCAILNNGRAHPQKHCALFSLSQELDKLLFHSWFSRVWTFQELIVAQKPYVVCGSQWMAWADFRRAMPQHWDSAGRQESNISLLKSYDPSRPAARSSSTTLLPLLIATRFREASDSRDKVFALLNIPQLQRRPAIDVDYNASVEEVFARAAAWCVHAEQDLRVLHVAVWRSQHRRNDMPSWVPNWDSMRNISRWSASKDAMTTKAPSLLREIAAEHVVVVPTNNPSHLRILGSALATILFSLPGQEDRRCSTEEFYKADTQFTFNPDIGEDTKFVAFHAIHQGSSAHTRAESSYSNFPVVKLKLREDWPGKDLEQQLLLAAARADNGKQRTPADRPRQGRLFIRDISNEKAWLKCEDMVVALYGGTDLYILRRTPNHSETGELVYQLVAVTDRDFIKTFGKSCFPPFQPVEQFFVLG
jgi:hypothetical protein